MNPRQSVAIRGNQRQSEAIRSPLTATDGLLARLQAIATMQAMGDGGWAAAGVIVIGGSLLCLIYTIVPLGMLKQFARFSQVCSELVISPDLLSISPGPPDPL